MQKNSTATFIGHRECSNLQDNLIRNEIEKLVLKGIVGFLNGGMGDFVWKCAR